MALIFVGSTDVLSSQRTSRFIGPLLRWLNPNVSDETIGFVQAIVRKGGHLAEYAILAMLAWRAVGSLARNGERCCLWKCAIWAFTISFLYAISDEFHQSFVDSRYGSSWDVLIDTAGATIGIAVSWWISQHPWRTKEPRSLKAKSVRN